MISSLFFRCAQESYQNFLRVNINGDTLQLSQYDFSSTSCPNTTSLRNANKDKIIWHHAFDKTTVSFNLTQRFYSNSRSANCEDSRIGLQ